MNFSTVDWGWRVTVVAELSCSPPPRPTHWLAALEGSLVITGSSIIAKLISGDIAFGSVQIMQSVNTLNAVSPGDFGCKPMAVNPIVAGGFMPETLIKYWPIMKVAPNFGLLWLCFIVYCVFIICIFNVILAWITSA